MARIERHDAWTAGNPGHLSRHSGCCFINAIKSCGVEGVKRSVSSRRGGLKFSSQDPGSKIARNITAAKNRMPLESFYENCSYSAGQGEAGQSQWRE